MEKTAEKRWYRTVSPIYLILIFSVFITSCNGQNKEGLRKIKVDESTNQTRVDPLFYIDGQLCQHLRRISQDQNGNLWFGTNVYGLMRYSGDTLEYFDESDGLGMGRITAILEDDKGNVWFSTAGGLTKYEARMNAVARWGGSFTNFTAKDDLINNEIFGMALDDNGMFWLGTLEGVSRFDPNPNDSLGQGGKFSSFPIPKVSVDDTTSILSYNRVSTVLVDKQGIIWFGTDGFGICKYDPAAGQLGENPFEIVTKEDGLPDNNVGDLMEAKNGNIWIGTMYGGVSMYDGRTFTNFTQNGVIEGVEVGAFYEEKNGNIWFAAEHHGVYCYDGKTFTNYNEKDGLNTGGILSIFEDREGRLWLGGWGGLFRHYRSTEKGSGKSFVSVTMDGPWQ